MTDVQVPFERRPPSVAVLLRQRVTATPDAAAYRYPVPPASGDSPDRWETLTWAQTARRVDAIAAGLVGLGVEPGQRVAIASSTRIEWILADLGVLCAGAATTTVYPQTNADETAYILADSASRVLIAENAAQLAKARRRPDELPELSHVVVIDPAGVDLTEKGVLSLDELERRGAERLKESPGLVRERVETLTGDRLATLIYTSGTTGRPKGVRLRHDSWSYLAKATAAWLEPEDVLYLWLPLAHVFGKALISAQIEVGHVAAVDGRVDRIADNLRVVRPTYLAAVPRIFEKVHNGIVSGARAGGTVKYRIFRWAARTAAAHARAVQAGLRRTGRPAVPPHLAAAHRIADALVYRKVREVFGGNLRICFSGGAALTPEIGYFLAGAGVPVLEGYGLTESCAVSFLPPADANRTGTVGKVLPGTEARVAEDGEILLRGPGVMDGYHRLPEETAAALGDDGWLRTGDIGELSPDGYLRVTDRKKDLFKTSGGKYIAPTEIEGRFKAMCPHVSHVLVHGAGRNYCTALIALDRASVLSWAEQHGLRDLEYAEVVAHPSTVALVEGYVSDLNASLQPWQTIKKFRLLPRDLDVERDEVTPSQKVKRPVVEQEFRALLDEMYAGARDRV